MLYQCSLHFFCLHQVYDGDNTNFPLVGTFCGLSIPAYFLSSGNFLTIHFFTDSSVQKAGFNATYRAVPCNMLFFFSDLLYCKKNVVYLKMGTSLVTGSLLTHLLTLGQNNPCGLSVKTIPSNKQCLCFTMRHLYLPTGFWPTVLGQTIQGISAFKNGVATLHFVYFSMAVQKN